MIIVDKLSTFIHDLKNNYYNNLNIKGRSVDLSSSYLHKIEVINFQHTRIYSINNKLTACE